MTDRPKVSVLVASYDVEGYVGRCLESVVEQSLRDIEVIVVDDASNDGSVGVIREYERRDDRVRLVEHERNRGLGGARNTGLDHATGDFVAFVDGDDWLRRDALALAYARCLETGAPVCLFPALDYFEDEDRYEPNAYTSVRITDRTRVGPDTLGSICATTWSKLYRLDLVRASGVRFPEGLVHEDEQFFFCFFAKTEPVVATLRDPVYIYRQRSASLMGRQRHERRDFPRILSNIWEFLLEEELTTGYADFLARMIAVQIRRVLPQLRPDAQETYYEGLRDLVRRMEASSVAVVLPPPLPEIVGSDYATYLMELQHELVELREDPWYRFGQLDVATRVKRVVVWTLKKTGLYGVVRSLVATIRR